MLSQNDPRPAGDPPSEKLPIQEPEPPVGIFDPRPTELGPDGVFPEMGEAPQEVMRPISDADLAAGEPEAPGAVGLEDPRSEPEEPSLDLPDGE